MSDQESNRKHATLRSLAREAGRTFGGMFLLLCPSVVAVPVTAGAKILRGEDPQGIRPGLFVVNGVGIAMLIASGALAQRFAAAPSMAQIAASYLATCGAVALVGTAANMTLIGWTAK